MGSRAKLAAAVASMGVVGLGWAATTATGQALVGVPAASSTVSAEADPGARSAGAVAFAVEVDRSDLVVAGMHDVATVSGAASIAEAYLTSQRAPAWAW